MLLSRVAIAAVFFVVGTLMIDYLLTHDKQRQHTTTKPSVTVTSTVTAPSTGRPTATVTIRPTVTITATPGPVVSIVVPSSISVNMKNGNSGGDGISPWAALAAVIGAAASIIAGVGTLAGGVFPWLKRPDREGATSESKSSNDP